MSHDFDAAASARVAVGHVFGRFGAGSSAFGADTLLVELDLWAKSIQALTLNRSTSNQTVNTHIDCRSKIKVFQRHVNVHVDFRSLLLLLTTSKATTAASKEPAKHKLRIT